MENNIRVFRAMKRVSQDKMAEDLKVHRQTIFGIENKKFLPSAVLMFRIAEYFDRKVDEVFWLEDSDRVG